MTARDESAAQPKFWPKARTQSQQPRSHQIALVDGDMVSPDRPAPLRPRFELHGAADGTGARLTAGSFPLHTTIDAKVETGDKHTLLTTAERKVITAERLKFSWQNHFLGANHFSLDVSQLKLKTKMAVVKLVQRHIPPVGVYVTKNNQQL